MANHNSTQYQNILDDDLTNPALVRGPSRSLDATTGTPTAQNDTITFFRPRAGERWDPSSLAIWPASGAGVNMKIGYAPVKSDGTPDTASGDADDDAFLASTDVSSAGRANCDAAAGRQKLFDGNEVVFATLTDANPTDAIRFDLQLKTTGFPM